MITVYGAWRRSCLIHAVGYDGKWLCGKTGRTSTVCGDNLYDVTCSRCLDKLNDYLKHYALTSRKLNDLKESLIAIENLLKASKGDNSVCAVKNFKDMELYVNSWILPGIRNVINYYGESD